MSALVPRIRKCSQNQIWSYFCMCVPCFPRFSLEAALAADDGLKRHRVGEIGPIYQ